MSTTSATISKDNIVGTGTRVKGYFGHGTILSISQYNEATVACDDGKRVMCKLSEIQTVLPDAIKQGTTVVKTVVTKTVGGQTVEKRETSSRIMN